LGGFLGGFSANAGTVASNNKTDNRAVLFIKSLLFFCPGWEMAIQFSLVESIGKSNRKNHCCPVKNWLILLTYRYVE
jgi:hypothetical protein